MTEKETFSDFPIWKPHALTESSYLKFTSIGNKMSYVGC